MRVRVHRDWHVFGTQANRNVKAGDIIEVSERTGEEAIRRGIATRVDKSPCYNVLRGVFTK